MNVTLFATEAGAAHACELARGLDKYCNLTAVWGHASAYKIDDIYPQARIGMKHIPMQGDVLIIVGLAYFKELDNSYPQIWKGYKKIKFILPDGRFMREREFYNNRLKDYEVFTTNCKYEFADFPVREYYQPFDLSFVRIEKGKRLTIGHSVFAKVKEREKGTAKIVDVCSQKDADFLFIKNKNWRSNLTVKAKCHIFVDQIGHYAASQFGWNGGIGKSGLEAMLLDCLVICWGKFEYRELPVPPIAWCTYDTFEEVLDYYIKNEDERNKRIKLQRAWAEIYLNPDYCAKRILQI